MTKIIKYMIPFCMFLLMNPVESHGTMQWTVDMNAGCGDDSNRLLLGADSRATDGFDNGFEIRSILGGNVQASLDHPEWGRETSYFWGDTRSLTLPQEWIIRITVLVNCQMTFNWELRDIPQTVDLRFVEDATGTILDMKALSSFTYTNSDSYSKTFRVVASGYIETEGDAMAPETSITDIPEFSGSTSVTISFAGTDDITPAGELLFSYLVDNGGWTDWSQVGTVLVNDLSDGSHSISVKAKDQAGNEDGSPASAVFTVDTVSPVLVMNRPSPSVIWPPDGRGADVMISGSVSDAGSGIGSVSYAVSDEYNQLASSGQVEVSGEGGFSFPVTLTASVNRTDRDGRKYTVTVTVADRAGNDTSDTLSVRVLHDKRGGRN